MINVKKLIFMHDKVIFIIPSNELTFDKRKLIKHIYLYIIN